MSSSSSIWPKNRFSKPVLLTLEKLGFVEQEICLKYLCKQGITQEISEKAVRVPFFFPFGTLHCNKSEKFWKVHQDEFTGIFSSYFVGCQRKALKKSASVQLYRAQYDSEDICDFIWKKQLMSKLKMLQVEKAM